MPHEDSVSALEKAMADYHAGRFFENHRGMVPEQARLTRRKT